jgi:hypothetical protein
VHSERTVQSWIAIVFTAGSDAILLVLGPEIHKSCTVETSSTVGKILLRWKFYWVICFLGKGLHFLQLSLLQCKYDDFLFLLCIWICYHWFSYICLPTFYKRTVEHVSEPMTHLESIACQIQPLCNVHGKLFF